MYVAFSVQVCNDYYTLFVVIVVQQPSIFVSAPGACLKTPGMPLPGGFADDETTDTEQRSHEALQQ